MLDMTNAALDVRNRVDSESDIWNIANPYIGQYIYCLNNGFTYVITELKEETVGNIQIPNKLVKSYKQITTSINYRGEYKDAETPLNPIQGDWYRNETVGESYIYQNGEWCLLSKDGKSGEQGEKGDTGEAGKDGQSIQVKGVLDNEALLDNITDAVIGDAYIINGNLWVFGTDPITGEGNWYNAGPFRGEDGISYVVDIRYSNDVLNKMFTTNDGLDPGVYIGIRTTTGKLTQQPSAFDNYTWSELVGTNMEMLFKHVDKTVTNVTAPNGTDLDDILTNQGWSTDIDGLTEDQYTWMTTAESKAGIIISNWTTPIRITGMDGQPGLDGTDVQFAYKLSNSNTIAPDWNKEAMQIDNYYMGADYGWTNDAQGVTKALKYEWMSVRYKINKSWTAYSKPSVFAAYGDDGTDGGGVEYIFYRTKIHDTQEVLNHFFPQDWYNHEEYQSKYDWVPSDYVNVNEAWGGWYDNALGTDEEWTCEWVSMRRGIPNSNGKLTWGQFSTPALWAKYAKDGVDAVPTLQISLDNDNTFILTTESGEELNPEIRPSVDISIFAGDKDVTKLISDANAISVVVNSTYQGTVIPNLTFIDSSTNDSTIVDVIRLQFEITNQNYPLKTPIKFKFTVDAVIDNVRYKGTKVFTVSPVNDPNFTYYEISTANKVIHRKEDNTVNPAYLKVDVNKFSSATGKTLVEDWDSEKLWVGYAKDGGTQFTKLTKDSQGIDCQSIENQVQIKLLSLNEDGGVKSTLDDEIIEVIKSAEAASFVFYQLEPSSPTISATVKLLDNLEFQDLWPTTVKMNYIKQTELGATRYETVPDGCELDWALYAKPSDGGEPELLESNTIGAGARGTFDIYELMNDYIPSNTLLSRLEFTLRYGETKTNSVTSKIDFIYSYVAPSVNTDIPNWVEEWDGTAAQVYGNNLLATKAYVGDAPSTNQTDWHGILMGSDVASVRNLPWGESEAKDFSGIIAVKNFDTNASHDNDFADVTFALDADTGNAYFKGEIHATDGEFTGTINATSGSFQNGTINHTLVSDLDVNNGYISVAIGRSSRNAISIVKYTNVESSHYKITVTKDRVNGCTNLMFNRIGGDFDAGIDVNNLPEIVIGQENNYIPYTIEGNVVLDNYGIFNSIAGLEFDEDNIAYANICIYRIVKKGEKYVEIYDTNNVAEIERVWYNNETPIDGEFLINVNLPDYYNSQNVLDLSCDGEGNVGKIVVYDLNQSSYGGYHRTEITGEGISVYSGGDEDMNAFVKIQNGDIIAPAMFSTKSDYFDAEIGTLVIDSEGYVRVSNGEGGYINQ